jgi:hypothetical protein
MKRFLILTIGVLLLLPVKRTYGQDADTSSVEKFKAWELWGVGIKATTDGVGFEAVKGFGNRLNIRVGYSGLTIPYSTEIEMEGFSARVDASLNFSGANLFIDFYPVKNVIHLTAGMVYNTMRHSVALTPVSEYPFGDIQVPPEDLGQVEGELLPGTKFSPYAALGFGNTLSRKHRVSFNFEMGAMYHGSPQVLLTGTKMLSPLASENNMTLLTDAIAQYKWYPMLSMQLTFRII